MDNNSIKLGLRNMMVVIMSQGVSFSIGIARAMILPVVLGITNFGYWQVYLLYISYAGIFALGYNDGLYLRFGKYNYEQLPKPMFRTSIKVFIAIQLIVTIIVSSFILLEPDSNKQIALLWVSLNIPIAGLMGVLLHVLQATNQLKKYSLYTIIDKIIVLVCIIAFLYLKTDNFKLVIIADTFSKIVTLALLMYSCKDLLFGPGIKMKEAYQEVLQSISVGINLMLANLSGMLVLGLGRFVVERFENINVHSMYSFAISTINLILVFVSAIGLVVYPTINRLEESRYSEYFVNLNQIISLLTFGLLIVFFPLKVIIIRYLADFSDIFGYLPLLFAIVFVQSKMQILINPYYKLLRKEKVMLKANVIGLILAVILIVPFYYLYPSVYTITFGTLVAMLIRLYLSESYLKKTLHIKGNKNVIFEFIGLILFILFANQSSIIFGSIGYFNFLVIFVGSQLKSIIRYYKFMIRK